MIFKSKYAVHYCIKIPMIWLLLYVMRVLFCQMVSNYYYDLIVVIGLAVLGIWLIRLIKSLIMLGPMELTEHAIIVKRFFELLEYDYDLDDFKSYALIERKGLIDYKKLILFKENNRLVFYSDRIKDFDEFVRQMKTYLPESRYIDLKNQLFYLLPILIPFFFVPFTYLSFKNLYGKKEHVPLIQLNKQVASSSLIKMGKRHSNYLKIRFANDYFFYNIHSPYLTKTLKYQHLELLRPGYRAKILVRKEDFNNKLGPNPRLSYWDKHLSHRFVELQGLAVNNTVLLDPNKRSDTSRKEKILLTFCIVFIDIIFIIVLYQNRQNFKNSIRMIRQKFNPRLD